ncbi:MAG: nucleotidyltransferase family protein [Lachnospiraceae bacterium]|nr:nucleotidyltransferase family protein [Lachnospiraceae bacterium]
MKTAAIIAECNPLHNGHAFLFSRAREETGADALLVFMSGDFVQRGEPALLDKHRRARMALEAGADLVFMLPTVYTVAPAEIFARGAVLTIDVTGIADRLVFGSESGDLDLLREAAALPPADPELHEQLLAAMREGTNYPRAMKQAITAVRPDSTALADLIDHPNNLLGIEYLRSITLLRSSLRPLTIPRVPPSGTVTSAQAIRTALREGRDASAFPEAFLPPASLKEIREVLSSDTEQLVFTDALDDMLRYRLTMCDPETLAATGDISGDLAHRILNTRRSCTGFEDYAALLRVKAFTLARIRRSLMQLLLDLRRADRDRFLENRCTALRVLGFRETARPLLREIGARKDPRIPLIVRGADHAVSDDLTARLIAIDQRAGALYNRLSSPDSAGKSEEEKPPVIF